MSTILTKHITKNKLIEINVKHLPESEYQKLDDAMSYNDGDYKYTFFTAIYKEGVFVVLPFAGAHDQRQESVTNEDFPVLSEFIKLFREDEIFIADFCPGGDTVDGMELYDWEIEEEYDENYRFT